MKQKLLSYYLLKGTVATLIIFLKEAKKMKAMVPLDDVDTELSNIVNGLLQGDIFKLYLYTIWSEYAIRMKMHIIKGNGFTLKKHQMQILYRRINE